MSNLYFSSDFIFIALDVQLNMFMAVLVEAKLP